MAEIAVGLATKQAEGLIDKLVDKLYATVSGELSLLLGVREEICFIKDELELMSAFLRKAEEKQNSDQLAKVWVKQVKELAYAVEDCIDEFSLHLPRRSSNINLAAALWHRVRSVGSLRARCRIAANIQSIKSKVKEVSERRLRYEINEKATSTDRDVAEQYDPRLSALFVNKSQLVGIDEPVEKLVKWLLDDSEPQLSLIGVFGAGGLGKTTIVKRAYEDPQVAGGHFDCRAWITVSQDYHIEELLRSMIKQLYASVPEGLDTIERTELVKMLRGYLKGKRYVIVFDDIWKIDAWKSLELILQENKRGSKIIITTRNKEVVEDCKSRIHGKIYEHEQGKLKEEDSEKLFYKRVFHEQQTCPEDLKKLSQDILQKCDGSPLAIVAIAATLAGKPKNSKEWEGFLRHLSTELESNPNLQGVMKILNFSYTDLPYHVQRCFLYLSRFPEDSVINCKRIKRLWVAEGFISARRDMSVEEVAQSYLNMLINRSMILPSKFNDRGEIRDFTIHDMMMEMIVSISVEENFVSRIQKGSTWLPQGVIRRLSIDSWRIPDDLSLSYLRSLVLFGNSVPKSLFVSPAFKLLRVLDLDGCRYINNKHLDGVCQLLHLKYLSLRYTDVTIIPKSIARLGNLETFDIRGCFWGRPIKIPVEMEKLKRLQLFRGDYLIVPTKLKLWKLTALQELGCLGIDDARGEKQLRNLYHLRKLDVWFRRYYAERGGYFLDSLKTMTSSLHSLMVASAYDADLNFLKDESTLVESPLVALKSLCLVGSLDALPNWLTSLTNLTKLTLSRTGLGADAIESLGTLPNLIQLVLSYMAYKEGERLCFSAETFKSLKLLHLWSPGSESVVFEIGAMPCLERALLLGVVQISGVENLIGLKKIELHGCEVGVVNSVKQAVEAHPNHPQLIIKRW